MNNELPPLVHEMTDAVQLPNGKWAVTFVVWRGTGEDRYVAAKLRSGPVFDTSVDAYAGGTRALQALKDTGSFPNMCEPF